MKRILFVCLGNICRSPLADGIAKKIVHNNKFDIEIDSAATAHWHEGEHPCADSIKVAKKNNVDISTLRARQVKRDDYHKFDFIIAMDESNREHLSSMNFPNVYLLGDFSEYDGIDVPDPYFFEGNDKKIMEVYTMVEKCVQDLIIQINNEQLI